MSYIVTGISGCHDAVFITGFGWCGGRGEAILDPPDYTRIKFYRGLPVFINDDCIREYVDSIVDPNTRNFTIRQIQITGCVWLEKKTKRNRSILETV